VKGTAHLHLVLKSRIRGALTPLPPASSWSGSQAQVQLSFTIVKECFVYRHRYRHVMMSF
jgi:hypothetical protein